MKKRILSLLLIVLLVFTAILLIINVSSEKQFSELLIRTKSILRIGPKTSQFSFSDLGVDLSVTSEIPDYDIALDSSNPEILKELLTRIKVYPFRDLPFIDSAQLNELHKVTISPKKISVIFRPFSVRANYPKNEQLYIEESETLYVMGQINESMEITIPIYVDLGAYEKYELSVPMRLSYTLLNALFFNFQTPPLDKFEQPANEAFRLSGRLIFPILKINGQTSFHFKNFLSNLIIKNAYAATDACQSDEVAACSGAINCGVLSQPDGTCAAPYGNVRCRRNSDCTAVGVTICNLPGMVCSPNGSSRACTNNGNNCQVLPCGGCIANNGNCNISCAPPTCTCTRWVPGACRVGGCQDGYRLETRTCSGGSCTAGQYPTGRCVYDASCLIPASPPPLPVTPPGCNCNWVPGSCGTGGCSGGEKPYSLNCNPGGCSSAPNSCVTDAACNPPPQPSPTPAASTSTTGTIQAVAVVVDSDTNTCTVIGAAGPSDTLPNTGFAFTQAPGAIPPAPQLYTGAAPVTWSNVQTGLYQINAVNPDPQYGSPVYCYLGNSGWTSGNPLTLNSGATLTWRAGFSTQNDWFQVLGGGVKSGGDINVDVPVGNYLVKSEIAAQKAPLVNYGGTLITGSGGVSTNNFSVPDTRLANASLSTYDYYSYYASRPVFETKTRIGNTVASDPGSGNNLFVYDVANNLTVSGSWDVEAGKQVVVFVPGDLNINATVHVAEGGFLAFVVGGNIIVRDDVGDAPVALPNKFTAHIQGVFIAQGTFTTQGTIGVADEQLVASGTYVANNFSLNRDLELGNDTNPGEVFIFRPDLWLNAPGALKEIDVTWTEVAP